MRLLSLFQLPLHIGYMEYTQTAIRAEWIYVSGCHVNQAYCVCVCFVVPCCVCCTYILNDILHSMYACLHTSYTIFLLLSCCFFFSSSSLSIRRWRAHNVILSFLSRMKVYVCACRHACMCMCLFIYLFVNFLFCFYLSVSRLRFQFFHCLTFYLVRSSMNL